MTLFTISRTAPSMPRALRARAISEKMTLPPAVWNLASAR